MMVYILFFFTGINILASAYMTFLTLKIAYDKCQCAVFNAYFVIIALYFFFSMVFLIYTLLIAFEKAQGYNITFLLTGYIIVTFVFVGATYMYTKYLTSKKCECISKEYNKLLNWVTLIRLMSAIIIGMSMLLWGLYAAFINNQYNFVKNK